MSELAGRKVYTRAELINRHGLGLSTLESWYRDRADTGHPGAAGKLGRSLVWDAEQWDTWYKDWTDTTGLAALDELAEQTRRSRSTLTRLWDNRANNGHPEPRKKIANTLYWDADEYRRWLQHDYERPDAEERLAQVDFSGRPDDQLTLAQFARVLGIPENTATTYARRPPAGWPAPHVEEKLTSGRMYRRYTRGQAWDYARNHLGQRHPGGGRPAGTTTARSHPYEGDPRLQVAYQALSTAADDERGTLATTLAEHHGGAPGTWARILTAARQHPPTPSGDCAET